MSQAFEVLRTELVKDYNALHASGAVSVVVKSTFLDNEIDFLNAASTEVADTEAQLDAAQDALVIAQDAATAATNALNGAIEIYDKAGKHTSSSIVDTKRILTTGFAIVEDGQEIDLGPLGAVAKITVNPDGSLGVTLLGGLL